MTAQKTTPKEFTKTITSGKNEGKRMVRFSIDPLEILKPRPELSPEIKRVIHNIFEDKTVKNPLLHIHQKYLYAKVLPEDVAIELKDKLTRLLEVCQQPTI